jgi:molybdopterin-containing oxidoreductase family iron-sulfur binding subunit
LPQPFAFTAISMHTHPEDLGAEAPLRFHPATTVNRRQALSLMAASTALATGACSAPPDARIHPFVQMPEAQAVGQALFYASAHVRDGYARGILIGTREGRPIKFEGNPLHPSSGGATDPITQAAVLQLWDPDRSGSVRQRLGQPEQAGAQVPMGTSSWAAFEQAWRERAALLDARRGDGLFLLTGPLTSPTDRALVTALLQRWPAARWHVHAPLDSGANGVRAAFGQEFAPVWRLQQARCIVALGGDPFSQGPGAVRHALDWSAARALGRDRGTWPRLFAAEVDPGLFGARADDRIALSPPRLEALVWRLARRWGPELPPIGPSPTAEEAAFETRLAQALAGAGPDALLIPGPSLTPATQALVHAINQRLGATGRGVVWIAAPDAAPQAGDLQQLTAALQAKAVDTLLMLDVNPVYDAPGVLHFAEALRLARWRVHAGLYADETAARCDWHLPLSHDAERWGDALAHDGSATVLQPAIAPLYDTRSSTELLALWAGDTERNGYALLQRQWRGARGDAAFDDFWRDALRRGVVPDSASPPVTPPPATLPAPPHPEAATLVAQFIPDARVHDGRYANLGWLQELPRPFTKLTWDNALLIGAGTAHRLSLATGDRVRVHVGSGHADWPVWVEPRHAEDCVSLPLGYGRTQAGRVGNGVGVDAFALQPLARGTVAVTLEKLPGQHAFAARQPEFDQHGRDLARHVRPGEAVERHDQHLPSLYPEIEYKEHKWGMAIDLDACIGCNACTIACQAENNIPVVGKEQVAAGREMHWIRVDRWDLPETGSTVFQPVPCMHCEKAPCELVCPVGATVHDSEGLNVQVYNRCIGTRFCSNNCPYKVRRFNFLQFTDETTETLKAQRNPDVTVRRRGVMEKCTYCLQRIARARHHEEASGQPLRDGDVVTACQAVCPTRAIRFGDLNDPASDIVRQKASNRNYALLGELDTQPRTTYLARVSNAATPPVKKES